MWRALSLFLLVLVAFGSFTLFSAYSNESNLTPSRDSIDVSDKQLPQTVHSIDLDKPFSFAEERVPTDIFDIRERLDRELLRSAYWHSNTVLNLKRARRFFPVIERILAENEVPADFKYLAVAESDLSNAVSPAGAKGVWQFMKGTGREYGLEVNNEVDERYHLEKSTTAACKYLKSLKKRFGSWTMAAAAYNMGGSRLNREANVQRGASYYDLNLNQETARYVFRILALKEIMSDPEAFGFFIDEKDKYPPLDSFYEVEVKEGIPNLGDFAQKYGISYRQLKVYNPWLISSKLTNKSKKTYQVRIPK